MPSGGFPVKLSPSNALRVWHAEPGFAQLENSTWGRIKKLDRTQPMHGELSDCYFRFHGQKLASGWETHDHWKKSLGLLARAEHVLDCVAWLTREEKASDRCDETSAKSPLLYSRENLTLHFRCCQCVFSRQLHLPRLEGQFLFFFSRTLSLCVLCFGTFFFFFHLKKREKKNENQKLSGINVSTCCLSPHRDPKCKSSASKKKSLFPTVCSY